MNNESYLVYGPPGSGKSTSCKILARESGLKYISVGDITRDEVAMGTDLGIAMKAYLDVPIEYPPDFIGQIVEARLDANLQINQRFIMDGYPKYPEEAERFKKFLTRHPELVIGAVFMIDVPESVAISRVKDRYICSLCNVQVECTDNCNKCKHCGGLLIKRDDDTEDFVKRRYSDYNGSVKDTIGILRGEYLNLVVINGLLTVDKVVESMKLNMKI